MRQPAFRPFEDGRGGTEEADAGDNFNCNNCKNRNNNNEGPQSKPTKTTVTVPRPQSIVKYTSTRCPSYITVHDSRRDVMLQSVLHRV